MSRNDSIGNGSLKIPMTVNKSKIWFCTHLILLWRSSSRFMNMWPNPNFSSYKTSSVRVLFRLFVMWSYNWKKKKCIRSKNITLTHSCYSQYNGGHWFGKHGLCFMKTIYLPLPNLKTILKTTLANAAISTSTNGSLE